VLLRYNTVQLIRAGLDRRLVVVEPRKAKQKQLEGLVGEWGARVMMI
jgi:hypothetical protein